MMEDSAITLMSGEKFYNSFIKERMSDENLSYLIAGQYATLRNIGQTPESTEIICSIMDDDSFALTIINKNKDPVSDTYIDLTKEDIDLFIERFEAIREELKIKAIVNIKELIPLISH